MRANTHRALRLIYCLGLSLLLGALLPAAAAPAAAQTTDSAVTPSTSSF